MAKLISLSMAAELLGLSPVTIQRWVYQGKIPYKMEKDEIFFSRSELKEWAQLHDINFVDKSKAKTQSKTKNILYRAVENGGVYFDIGGKDIYSVLKNSLDVLDFIPSGNKEEILNQMLDREELTSTGIGKGFAIPHTRKRLDIGLKESYVPVIFLKNEIEYNSIDNLPVKVLFMMFTKDTKEHLNLLSKISLILQREDYCSGILNCKDVNELMKILEKVQ